MDALFEKLLTTGGPLGVLVAVVYLFLRYLTVRDRDQRMWMERMHSEHLLARTETRLSLEKNTTSMDRNTTAIGDLAKSVADLTLKGGAGKV